MAHFTPLRWLFPPLFSNELKAHAQFERISIKKHSKSMNDKTLELLLSDYFNKNQFLHRKDMEKLCQFTPSMTKRKLKELVAAKKLLNINTPHYPLDVSADRCSEMNESTK